MLFNSFTFWGFFLIVALIYWRLPLRAQNRFLLAASYFFYAYWDWRFLSLLIFSTVVDYGVSLGIANSSSPINRKRLLILSIGFNLTLLGIFKYLGFFVTQAQVLLNAIGFQTSLPVLQIILPVGLSFYTFQSMSYVVDVYKRETEPIRGFLDFALFLSFFPQLIAGPIERAQRLFPQFQNERCIDRRSFEEAVFLVATGLFRKVVIADNMAMIANGIFSKPAATLSAVDVLVGCYSFAFQIYGDFSGYSAIAQGTARFLGFNLMANFRQPYFATNPQEFWKRWHISLSSWLRDYLYIPLGGNRQGRLRTDINLCVTMLLGGAWHGANWTFIIWGGLHGAILVGHRRLFYRRPRATEEPGFWQRLLFQLGMFHFLCLTWLFFRADSLSHALETLHALLRFESPASPIALFGLGLIAFLIIPFFLYERWVEQGTSPYRLLQTSWLIQAAVYFYIVFMLLFFSAPVRNEFIYFQF